MERHEKDNGVSGTIKANEYIRSARTFLKNGEHKAAYGVLLQAVVHYPENALVLSYFGCLQAIVDKKYRSGIEACRKAVARFKAADMYTAGIVYPILYLNLGRAYLAAGRKKEATEAFGKGLAYDRNHSELRKEQLLLGVRKRPPVPFLSRSNPLNKYIGLLLHAAGKHPKKGGKR